MPVSSLDLLPVFNAQPGATLLLSPDWVIVGASDDYLAATLTERDVLVGQHIFDAFPDNPETPEANAVANVRASLEQVLATKQPHEMAPQHYDVPDPARPGRFVERHWQPRHTPVLDAQGQVQFILQSVQDITARRLAERQLYESQVSEQAARAVAELQRTELQRVYQEAPVAMGLLRGPTFVLEWANARMGNIWGRPLDQVVGRPHFEALPDLAGQGFEQIFTDVLTTGRTVSLQEILVRIDQPQQAYQGYFNITYQPIYEGSERITGILCSAFEVTEQVLARQQVQTLNEELATLNEELRASNEEYQEANTALSVAQQELQQLNQELEVRVQQRTQEALAAVQRQAEQRAQLYQIFEETPAAICIQRGPEHRYEYANAAYLSFFPGREFLGRPVAEVLPETVDSGVVALLDRVYQTGETYYGYELPLLIAQPAGPPKQMYFTFTYQAYRENGEIVGISTFAYDVADRVRVRQQREESFRLMANAAPAMLWVTDPNGQCTYLNAQWYQFTGQTEAEALGVGWTTAVHPDDAQEAGQTFLDANTRRVPFHYLYRLRRRDGEYRWAIDTGLPHFTEAGEYAGIVGTVIDVHEQQLAEQELQTRNEQLLRTNADLDNFIYTASHDLKAPISNIEGLLYLLRDELPTEVVEQGNVGPALHLMQEAIERFKRTIEHLTEVSKLQKEYAPATQAVSLATVVEDVRQDLAPLIQETDVRLLVDVSDLPPVRFSEKNLRSVVYNLLSNALKYRSPDRSLHVDVRAHVRTGYTVLEVHDNGLGIESRHLPQLFTMFQRFHTHVEGTGIGLFMVKRMVDNAGGRLEVHSQLGAGTTFFVHLPHATSTLAKE
ncbi:PAS domain-containing sensor histidine kinase [Hymenobacter norwichensis]|uniref:PAS domain-containing sensor histidine kinase n=1 Tax=Hymenobacter norwichensis TaxID=223903 RepID=UPI0003B3F333|nr:PAS domain-containing protein [Hymenobacter norwichensis]